MKTIYKKTRKNSKRSTREKIQDHKAEILSRGICPLCEKGKLIESVWQEGYYICSRIGYEEGACNYSMDMNVSF